MDDLTPMVADEAQNLIPEDVVVNVGTVYEVRSAGEDHVFVEFLDANSGFTPGLLFGRIMRSNLEVIRWAREGEL